MRTISVFNNITLDGYFTDANNDMSWAYNVKPDPEFNAFVAGNASSDGVLMFGRITYQMMASYWPTEAAIKSAPTVAEGMNRMQKVVFSKTMTSATWNNTQLLKGDLIEEVKKMKSQPGKDIVILGSGSLVAQLAQAGLIDNYQFVVIPVALGKGRTLFEGLKQTQSLKLTKSQSFANGNVFLSYKI